jgi:ribokinase
MSRIVVVGGINMDLHLFGGRRPSTGSALLVDHYLTQPGGKGSNVARAAARLGAEVQLVGRVGDDDFGHRCVDEIRRDGVDVTNVTTSAAPTGFVAIELDRGYHRTLVFAPGANDELAWPSVEPVIRSVAPGDLVIVQPEIPLEVLAPLARLAAAGAIDLFVDPAPPDRMDPMTLRAAEVITPDRAEAAALVGRADTSEVWPELAAAELLAAGARTVVVKTGATGAVLADEHGVERIATLSVEAQDETGAGDVFIAALAVRRSEGAGWSEAVRFANVASALSVADHGLLLPDRTAVESALATARVA